MAIEDIKELADRIPDILRLQPNEAQTNQWLVEPFIEALGYRISDPTQVERESAAAFGDRQSYKVDYMIKSEGVPIVVIECKKTSERLNVHTGQLKGYFNATASKIAETGDKKGLLGILTNGLIYQFFTDQNEPNVLDNSPFWEIDVQSLDSKALEQLKRIEKGNFSAVDAVKGASELNHIKSIKDRLTSQLESPDDDFVDLFGRRLHSGGNYMSTVREVFRPLVLSAFQEFVDDQIRMNYERGVESRNIRPPVAMEEEPEDDTNLVSENAQDADMVQEQQPTDEELQGYEIVKAIVRDVANEQRIRINDTVNYCLVYLDRVGQPLCRFYFNSSRQKRIVLYDGGQGSSRIEIRHDVGSPQDIHNHAEQLRETARRYLES